MTTNQLIFGLETFSRWARVRSGSVLISPMLRSELKKLERVSAEAAKAWTEQVKAKEAEMGKAKVIIASLTAALFASETNLKAATSGIPATSVYDAADLAAIENFEANDPTTSVLAESEPTIAAGLITTAGVQQAYTTFNGIQTDAANMTLYVHTGVGGFDTGAWPLAGTVNGENVYYFALDQSPGDAKGNAVANSWATIPAIVAPPATTDPTSSAGATPTDGTAATATASTGS
jgi:predicted lipoprotein with Yx(FWY)xxD motif